MSCYNGYIIITCAMLQKSLFSETSTEGLLSPSPIPALDDPGGVPLLSATPASEVGPLYDIKYFNIKFLQIILLLYVEFSFF